MEARTKGGKDGAKKNIDLHGQGHSSVMNAMGQIMPMKKAGNYSKIHRDNFD